MPPKKLSGAQNKKIREEKVAAVRRNTTDISKFLLTINKTQDLSISESTPTPNVSGEKEGTAGSSRENSTNTDSDNNLQEYGNNSTKIVENEESDARKEQDIDFNNPTTWRVTTESIRMYIEHGPDIGDNVEFYPATDNRRFEKIWFTKIMSNGERITRNWIIYCEQLDSLFCYPCVLFSNEKNSVWITGFKDWKHLNPLLPRHENSSTHRTNYIRLREFEKKLNEGGFIDDNLLQIMRKEKSKWRHILTVILDAILHCIKNNDALRGSSETFGHPNCGKFLNTIELISHYDPIIKNHIEGHQKGQVSYFSPAVQNELIGLAAKKVKTHIIENIKIAKYFSILFDCTTDVSHREQMVQIIRYVNIDSNRKCTIKESFIDFINTSEKSGEGLAKDIENKLTADGLEIANIRGQSYDNGANMAGMYKGVQARILQLNDKAVFIPCSAHSLNLVGVHAAQTTPKMITFFGTVQQVYNFFVNSSGRWELIKSELKLTLKGTSDTRWSSKANAVHALSSQLNKVIDIFENIISSKSSKNETVMQATSLLNLIKKFEFVCYLTFWDNILSKINRINLALQEKQLVISKGAQMLKGLLIEIKEYRTDFFETVLNLSESMANQLGIEAVLEQPRRRKKPKMPGEKAVDEANLFDIKTNLKIEFLQVIDSVTTQMEERFVALHGVTDDFGFLSGRSIDSTTTEELRKKATDLALKYTDDLNAYEFIAEMESLKFQGHALFENFIEMGPLEILQSIYDLFLENIYPNLQIAIRIFLSLPLTTATCERSFSKLKLVKSYLRSTLGQEKLTNVSILSIEKSISLNLDCDEIIDVFADIKSRKVKI